MYNKCCGFIILDRLRVPHSHVKRSTVARHRLILTHKTLFFFRWFISDVYIALVFKCYHFSNDNLFRYLKLYWQDISFYNQSGVVKVNSFFLDNSHVRLLFVRV